MSFSAQSIKWERLHSPYLNFIPSALDRFWTGNDTLPSEENDGWIRGKERKILNETDCSSTTEFAPSALSTCSMRVILVIRSRVMRLTPPAQTKWSDCSTGTLFWSFAPSATFGCDFGSPEVNCNSSVEIALSSKRRILIKRFAIPAMVRRCFFFWGEIDGEDVGVWRLEERERGRNIQCFLAVYNFPTKEGIFVYLALTKGYLWRPWKSKTCSKRSSYRHQSPINSNPFDKKIIISSIATSLILFIAGDERPPSEKGQSTLEHSCNCMDWIQWRNQTQPVVVVSCAS